MTLPAIPEAVAAAFAVLPAAERTELLNLRDRLFALAETLGVGPLTETLKWGQPSYLTAATKAGTTVRLGLIGGKAAVFVSCQTALVEGFRVDFPEAFEYSGNRALLLAPGSDEAALDICLSRAMTYHRAKRKGNVA